MKVAGRTATAGRSHRHARRQLPAPALTLPGRDGRRGRIRGRHRAALRPAEPTGPAGPVVARRPAAVFAWSGSARLAPALWVGLAVGTAIVAGVLAGALSSSTFATVVGTGIT